MFGALPSLPTPVKSLIKKVPVTIRGIKDEEEDEAKKKDKNKEKKDG